LGKKLIKATAVVSVMTLISRLLGFVRDMLIARLFGVDAATDAFFVIFKIPNLLRRLFAEGAFAHALVPVLTAYKQTDQHSSLKEFIAKLSGQFILWSMLLTLIAFVLAPALVLLLAPGFAWQSSQYDLAVDLLRITLPFGACIVLVAFAGAVLNAHDRFALPALTPVFLNLSMIAAALWLAPRLNIPIMALAWGISIAGVVQLLAQMPSIMKLRLLALPRFVFSDPETGKTLGLMLPAIFSASVTQVNLLLDTLIASFLVSGSVSWLYYSDRLVEFPLGILGMALSTVILPQLSKNHAMEDGAAFSSTLDWGLRWVVIVGMPATIGLFLLAEPTLSTLFQYDEFMADDVRMAGLSLKAYAVGLLGYLLIKILVPGFSSRLDLKTPVRYGLYSMLISLAMNVLAIPLAHAGLALATSMGALINAGLLLKKLLRDKVYCPGTGWLPFLLRVALASMAMAFTLWYYVDISWWRQWGAVDRILHLIKWIATGCLVYGSSLLLCGLRGRHLSLSSDKIAPV
jgi:putative peptidoglycan lipid II flippase